MSEKLCALRKIGGGKLATPWCFGLGSGTATKEIDIDTTKNLFIYGGTTYNHNQGVYSPSQILASSSSAPFFQATYGNQSVKAFWNSSTSKLNVTFANVAHAVLVYADDYIYL